MSKDLMKEIEEKFNQQIYFPNSVRISKELLKLFLKLRLILIEKDCEIKDGKEYSLSGLSFLKNSFIDTIIFYPKKFLKIIDTTDVYFTTKKEGFEIVYSVSNDGFEKFNRRTGK